MTRDDPSAFAPPPAFGPFRVLHQIGVGALGPVFRTYEPTGDRLVAVKVFRLDVTPEQAQALADELSRAADAGLFHPSIVEPVASGVEGTVAYRAEEYVAAESLDIAIRDYAPAPPDRMLPFITQLAGAIDFARAAGVGHGALHLRDIFVTSDEARAGGFGIVEALERVGLRAPVRRPYSAPERIAGVTWGTPADVFSLAAIAFELLTGRRPSGTGAQIGRLDPETAGGNARALHEVLTRAMDDDPSRRYPAALAFASALEAAVRGERVTGAVAQVSEIAGTAPPAAVSLPPRAERPSAREALDDAAPPAAGPATLGDEDDIAGERDFDEAYSMLDDDRGVEHVRTPERNRATLFEDTDEAAGDELALRDDRAPASDRIATAAAASVLADAPERTAAESYYRGPASTRPPDTDDRDYAVAPVEPPRTDMLPRAIFLVVGLLVGFVGGLAVGQRLDETPGRQEASAAPEPGGGSETASTPPQPSQPEGRAYSEQAVPPTAPVPAPEAAPASPPPAAPAAAAPRAAATRGTLVVRSTPSRANVTIDGRWAGRTPLTLDDRPLRRYSIRVVQDGYAVATETVTLTPEAPSRTVSVALKRTAKPPARGRAATPPPAAAAAPTPTNYLGSIYVDSRPRGARVVLNGKVMGQTPLRIPEVGIGSHVIRLELEDHRTWTSSTRVQAGAETRVTGSLERIR